MQTTIEVSMGVAAVVAVVINALKMFNVIKSDAAPTWSLAMNLVGTAAMLVFGMNLSSEQTTEVNSNLTLVATAASAVLQLVGQLLVTWLTHKGLSAANVPVLGTSNTKRIAGKVAA